MEAWAWLGVTVVNAVAAWRGATAAIKLRVRARLVSWRPSCRESDLACNVVLSFVGRGAEIRVVNEAGFSGGLKSSSAVSNASLLAASRALGLHDPSPLRIVEVGARVSRRMGISVTGAHDDAYASLLGGIAVTDNARGRLVRRREPPRGVKPIVFKPRGVRRLWPPRRPEALREASRLALRAWLYALEGDMLEAVRLNWAAYREYLGAPEWPVRLALEAGALAATVSGLGPSYVAYVDESRVGSVVDRLRADGGIERLLVADFAVRPACCLNG